MTVGDAATMKKLLERALPIFEQEYGPDHPEVAILAPLAYHDHKDADDGNSGDDDDLLLPHSLLLSTVTTVSYAVVMIQVAVLHCYTIVSYY